MFMRKTLLLLLALFQCLVTFTSCSSDDAGDDEGGKTDTPALSAEAAFYQITSDDAEIESVELTEGGTYFIVKDEVDFGAKPAVVAHAYKKKGALRLATRAADNGAEGNILTGTYTKIAEGEYALNGFGSMKVTADGDRYTVTLQQGDAAATSYAATRVKSAAATVFDTQLCNTWKFASVNYTVKYGSHTMANVTASSWMEFYTKMKQLAKDECDEEDPWTDEDEQEYNQMIANARTYGLRQAVFTAAGRLYLSYGPLVKNYLWKWKGSKTLGLWSYDTDLDEDGKVDANEWNSDIFFTTTDYPNFSAVTTVDIVNGKLILTDTDKEVDEDEGVAIEQTMKVTFAK